MVPLASISLQYIALHNITLHINPLESTTDEIFISRLVELEAQTCVGQQLEWPCMVTTEMTEFHPSRKSIELTN